MNKYTKNSSNGCVLEVDLEYPKELHELHNDYPLASDKIEINVKRLSRYQLKIADFYNVPIGNVKKLVLNILCALLWELVTTEFMNKTKKVHGVLEFNQSQWLKQWVEFNTKENRSRKEWWQRC